MKFKAAKPSSPKASGTSYWIMPPGGRARVRYRRVSKFISVLDDGELLVNRDLRYAGYGVAKNPKLAQQIADLDIDSPEDKYVIQKTVERAARQAGKWFRADMGTAIHAVTEDFDSGHDVFTKSPPDTPAVSELKWGPKDALMEYWPTIRQDVRGYANLVDAYEIEFVNIEATVVLDQYHVAGTLDRLMKIGNFRNMPRWDGPDVVVGDLKAGSIDFGRMEKPMQFKSYAGGVLYNHDTHERKPHGAHPDIAVVIHVPMGEGQATLVPLDLSQAAKRLELAHQIWQTRAEEDVNSWQRFGIEDWLSEQIAAVTSEPELESLYARTQQSWSELHVQQAQEKAQQL